MLTGEQFGEGRSSREVWLQAKVYLYVCEVFGDETWQTGEPVFYESRMIYNNNLSGKLQKETCKMLRLLHTGGRKHQQLRTDGIQEPENESPTITQGQLHYVYNYVHTLWNSILSPAHSRHAHFNSISQPSHAGGGTLKVTQSLLKLNMSEEIYDSLRDLCLAPNMS